MYRLESFSDGKALIVSDDLSRPYRAAWNAETEAEGDRIAVDLNRPELLEQLAQRRFDVETAGVEVAGVRIKTDRESQALVCNAFVSLTNELVPDVEFKAVSGWVRIDTSMIRAVAKAVAAHSRAVFAAEKVVDGKIRAAATMLEVDQLDIPGAFGAAYDAALAEVLEPAGA